MWLNKGSRGVFDGFCGTQAKRGLDHPHAFGGLWAPMRYLVHRHRNTLPRLYCLLLPLYTHQVQPQIFHLITAFVSISVAAFFAYSDTLSLTQYGR